MRSPAKPVGNKPTPLKLDLACSANKREGYLGVDYVETRDTDMVLDLLQFPWPWQDSSVEAIHSSHFVEHIPHDIPGVDREGFFAFMDECHRVLQPDGVAEFIHPYAMNTRAFQDPTHRRFIPEATWYYLNREWRETQGLQHYKVNCDFEVVTIVGLGVNDAVQLRAQEAQDFARAHYWHVIADLHVTLRARK